MCSDECITYKVHEEVGFFSIYTDSVFCQEVCGKLLSMAGIKSIGFILLLACLSTEITSSGFFVLSCCFCCHPHQDAQLHFFDVYLYHLPFCHQYSHVLPSY